MLKSDLAPYLNEVTNNNRLVICKTSKGAFVGDLIPATEDDTFTLCYDDVSVVLTYEEVISVSLI
ncbi:hypothetical protein [Streptococcus parauberis]|uniref:hypothetical protein n=1 Tax=Streptococcus parauberis TaxID=1348 RepID=UPI00378D9D8F